MADTNSNLRKRMVSAAEGSPSGSSGGPTPKKIKLEVDEPPQANPDTIEAVRQRNTALELDMKEKNRRIAFLARKCEALYRHRVLVNASVRSMRRQWFHAVDSARDALRALQIPDDDQAEDGTATLRSFESLGTPHVRAEDLALTLPEWFLSISKGDDRSVPLPSSSQDHSGDVKDEDEVLVKAEDLSTIEHDMQSQLESKRQEMVRLLSKLVEVTTQNGKCGREGEGSFSSIVEEKRLALDEVLRLKDQLHTSKLRLAEMERDLEDKETERHRACRDYDRLQKRVEQYGSSVAAGSSDDLDGGDANNANNSDDRKSVAIKDEKSPPTSEQSQSREQALMKDVEIIRDKLFQERRRIDGFRRELNSCRASELALTKEAAALKQEHDDKVQRLQEENARITEEFKKIEHKAKDMGKHLEERWQKKVDKMMADVAKYKTQHDTIQLKNLSLRNKLSDASSSRDQLNELKTEFESVKRENERLKAQVESERRRMDTIQLANDNAKISELQDKAAALDKINAELRKSCDLLKDGANTSGDDKISAYVARLSQLEGKYEQEVSDHQSTKSSLEEMRASMEEMKATADATREESDALLGEIEALGTEMEELRHGRKKLLQQVDEKRNALKKLGSQQQRDEQEKTHSFEEVMATRLQVTSLQAVQKHQKSVIDATKEALAAKEKELELLKEHVKTIEGQSEANDAEKRKALRDAEVAKQLYATEATKKQQQMLQEKKQACEQCEEHRKKEEKYKEMLAAAKGTGGSSTLSDTEHLELQDLQKAVKCSVCQDRQKTVIISKCFHMFCKECVDNNLKSRNRKCPTCKKMFGQDDVKAVWFT